MDQVLIINLSGEYKAWVSSRAAVVGSRLCMEGGGSGPRPYAGARRVVLAPTGPGGRRPGSPMPEAGRHIVSAMNQDGSQMV